MDGELEHNSGDGATVATAAPPAGAIEQSAIDQSLLDPSLYLNRELSWLDFNDRVLQLAEDQRLLLLER
ncbi:MAG: Polyphosphate kinase N-terminal domain, partial [Solirubrobacterales bacterium]|nr:Polyphosphate kinase N-terminal domain [Solirubrobacterales bacterium]